MDSDLAKESEEVQKLYGHVLTLSAAWVETDAMLRKLSAASEGGADAESRMVFILLDEKRFRLMSATVLLLERLISKVQSEALKQSLGVALKQARTSTELWSGATARTQGDS